MADQFIPVRPHQIDHLRNLRLRRRVHFILAGAFHASFRPAATFIPGLIIRAGLPEHRARTGVRIDRLMVVAVAVGLDRGRDVGARWRVAGHEHGTARTLLVAVGVILVADLGVGLELANYLKLYRLREVDRHAAPDRRPTTRGGPCRSYDTPKPRRRGRW